MRDLATDLEMIWRQILHVYIVDETYKFLVSLEPPERFARITCLGDHMPEYGLGLGYRNGVMF